MLINIPNIGLANIVAGKQVVPELIQADVNALRIAEEVNNILKNPAYMKEMKNELGTIKKKLGAKGASLKVAHLAYEMIS